VTVTGYAPDDLTPGRPDGSRTPVPARRTAFDDLADQAARLPWCWPALVTLAFGFYQVGRPDLWPRWPPRSSSWPSYPVGLGGYYVDYASAAAFVARQARAGDGIVYQAREHQDSWLMVGYGLQYYLARDMPNGVPVPRELSIAHTAAEVGTLYPEPCEQPAACLGAERRAETGPFGAVNLLICREQVTAGTNEASVTEWL
jgi:hypothetical protein